MKQKILVGLSGGVDSAVTAYLLKKQGYDVTAGFMINYVAENDEDCMTAIDLKVAKEVAEYLEIPFFTFNYVEEYQKKVLDYMYEGYKRGITPNPDIMCNSEVKFQVFLEEAKAAGFDMIATGHYARIEYYNHKYHLKKGIDEQKDQSYFLSGLNQEQLSQALFPIGALKKTQVRKIANDIGLPNAQRKDSQGICFVGKVDLSKFLEKKISPKPGNIVDTHGNILGTHRGVFYYTIGQRKGLDLGGQPKPVFVIKKDIKNNILTVGDTYEEDLYDNRLRVAGFHFLSSCEKEIFGDKSSIKGKIKIRYRQQDQEGEIFKRNNHFEVMFAQKQRAIAAGQICAIYLDDELVMSGVIE